MRIHSTQDYTLFKRIPGNRALSKPHVKRLLEAIEEDPETITFNPIVVNDKFEIIDGQHRLAAIERLGLPVHYIKVDDLGLSVVQRLNSIGKSWTPMDYAKSFAENGSDAYVYYIDFKNQFKYNHEILMRYLALGVPMTGTIFKRGGFKVPNPSKSFEYCVYLRDVSEFYDRATQRNVGLGFFQVMTSENYDHKRMLRQMKHHGHRFVEQALSNDYAREFERIYNYHSQDPVRLF